MKKNPVSTSADIETVSLCKTAQQRYLNYALSVITSRALPDVRDGLKPVQRRILYGMHEMHLSYDAKYQKSAQVVGQVMGRYHPHGDSSIYDAMVRLSQPFNMRYPFVDGQGNFGSIDGDPAAAMRYTEARLQHVADAMLDDLDEHIVDFQPNYSGTFREPTVLPAAIPALLVNGSTGIAVGMATNIPPHNLREAIDACIAVIDQPHISLNELVKIMPGPDFPTGGRILTGKNDILKVYESGRGPIDIQGEFTLEQDAKRSRIILTSLPYTVNKNNFCKSIKDLINNNKLPLLNNIHDESSSDIRIVLDLKTGADPNAVMAYLFKHTDFQMRFNVNMTCIVPGNNLNKQDKFIPQFVYQPKRMGLREIIDAFLQFRFDIITKRLQWQLHLLQQRIHILEGYRKLFSALDEAVQIIREAEDKTHAANDLCSRFDIDDIQADAILELRLYRLARLETDKIIAELTAKQKESAHISTILASDKKIWKTVRDELVFASKTYGDDRKTQLGGYELSENYTPENYIIDEDWFVIITKSGLFKRQKSFSDIAAVRTKDNDTVAFVRFGSTRAPLILLSSLGKAYTLLIERVPASTGHGSPIAATFNLADNEQIIAAFVDDPRFAKQKTADAPKTLIDLLDAPTTDERTILSVSRTGQTARIALNTFRTPSTATGRIFMRLNTDDTVIHAAIAPQNGFVSCIASNTRAIVFPISDVPILKTPGKGVRALSLDADTSIAAALLVSDETSGVHVKLSDSRDLFISVRRLSLGERGSKGRLLVRRGSVSEIFDDKTQIIDVPDIKDE